MVAEVRTTIHSAEAAALGFYYQTFYALFMLLDRGGDGSSVAVEQMDDVVLDVSGQSLLFQLKHSIREVPPPISIKSRALWSSIRVWIDALPFLELSETTFHLVAVGTIPDGSPLASLTSLGPSRDELLDAMVVEAQSVVDARTIARSTGTKLPYEDRAGGCDSFIRLSQTERLNLLRRTLILQDSPAIGGLEQGVAQRLKNLPPDQRPAIASRLIEWWDRQVIYSLCGKRNKVINIIEVQCQIMEIVGDMERGILQAEFELVDEPESYQPDGMLARQISIVAGKRSDYAKAIREEWRAREQRSKWVVEKPNMAVVIGEYDKLLVEHWSDLHCQVVENCENASDEDKRNQGLMVLRWTHERAPNTVRPISNQWTAPYYVRGSYQILAIDLEVGWHPDYRLLLRDE